MDWRRFSRWLGRQSGQHCHTRVVSWWVTWLMKAVQLGWLTSGCCEADVEQRSSSRQFLRCGSSMKIPRFHTHLTSCTISQQRGEECWVDDPVGEVTYTTTVQRSAAGGSPSSIPMFGWHRLRCAAEEQRLHQEQIIRKSVCRPRTGVDEDRYIRWVHVGLPCTEGRGSVQGQILGVLHITVMMEQHRILCTVQIVFSHGGKRQTRPRCQGVIS